MPKTYTLKYWEFLMPYYRALSRLFRYIIQSQVWLSRRFEKLFPLSFQIDGNQDFRENIAPKYVNRSHQVIYDLGGGSQPYVSVKQKQDLSLKLIGLDIEEKELRAAPIGAYDRIIVADLTRYQGEGDGDLVICQAVLEHVPNNKKAFSAISSALKPGGIAILFMPSRNAWFARINLLLPESLKRKLLFTLFPSKAFGHDGFPAFYDHCTPSHFRKFAEDNDFEILSLRPYYTSSYFQICFPIFVVWRLWTVLFRLVCQENAAETFSMILKKK